MIRVLDEARSRAFYKDAFGFEMADRREFETFTLIYLRNGGSDFELELTVNKGREQPYALGDGYGHMAVVVDDLEAEHRRFTQTGLNPGKLVQMEHEGVPMARFFFVADPDGYKTEVIERGGRFT